MIRLTLNAQSDPEFHLFSKSTILLGSDPSIVDLLLPGADILPVHLKIFEQGGFFIIANDANDPFSSVNGHPFGKKLLNSGDIIMVYQTTILFENLDSPLHENFVGQAKTLISEIESPTLAALPQSLHSRLPIPSLVKTEEENEDPALEKANSTTASSLLENHPLKSHPPRLESDYFSSFSLPFEQEVEILKEEEWEKASIDHLMKDLEASAEQSKEQIAPPLKEASPKEKKHTASLKDDYLRELEDDGTHLASSVAKPAPNEYGNLYQAWKWILFFIFSILFISGIAGTIIYFSVSDKTEAQETKAAQGVADLAIALTHARLNHLKPHNQNWSDVEFLKSNLQAILPETSSYASQIDSQGQFNCCPYTLRVYTNADLSHFLLIAQPAPNLLYWLIPQSMIIVDSHLMELRTLNDVRSLNRLLANPDPLEGLNGKEITNLIKQGGLIPLSALASDSGNPDFTPPKNLAWILPGTENLLYNAPRYYRLGQNIVHQAINLSTTKGSGKEVAALKQEVDNFACLNHFILYADQGKKSADLTRQGVAMFAPSDNLLFGYLLFNAQGKIHQAHLLKEEEETKESQAFSGSNELDIAFEPLNQMGLPDDQKIPNSSIDRNHPIYIQLHALAAERENELRPLISALFTLVNQELTSPRAQFQVEYQNLSHTYLMANAKHKKAIKEAIETLYGKYENIPTPQFLAYIQELHLEQLIQHDDHSLAVVDENCQQNMETLLIHIENSQSLAELNNIIHIAASWLNFDYIKDPQELMKYQNLLRNQLLAQLERCLLTQQTQIAFKEEDREILQDILNQERLIKPEERDFFLEEFDDFFHDHHHLESEQVVESEQVKVD